MHYCINAYFPIQVHVNWCNQQWSIIRISSPYLPPSTDGIKGYLNGTHSNTHSTQPKLISTGVTNRLSVPIPIQVCAQSGHEQYKGNTGEHQTAYIMKQADKEPEQKLEVLCVLFCFATLAEAISGTIYTNLTGKFPARSFKEYQYMFITYVYDINIILVYPMKLRSKESILDDYKTNYNHITRKISSQHYISKTWSVQTSWRVFWERKNNIDFLSPTNTRLMLLSMQSKSSRIILLQG